MEILNTVGFPSRSPGTPVRVLFFLFSLAAGALLLTAGFPPGASDRLPVLVFSVVIALCAAVSPGRGIALFCFIFPWAGLLARAAGGADPVTWPGVLLCGLAAGWSFRFIYDFESAPRPARADRAVKTLLVIWCLATVLAAGRAVTVWAAVRRLTGRAVNDTGLSDGEALKETLFAFAALAGGAAFYFLLRRAGETVRRRALSASIAGTALSALAAVFQRLNAIPSRGGAYWKMTGRLEGGAVDPNSLGLLCALGLLAAMATANPARPGRGRGRGSAAWSIVVSLLLGAGLLLSGSRSGLAVAAGSLALVLFLPAFRGRARAAAAAALVALAAAGVAIALRTGPGSAGARLAQTFDPALPLEYRVSARPLLWRAATRLFLRHPVEGAGMGAFAWELPDLLREEGRSLPSRDNPGSGYVQALAETGTVGFLVTACAALALAVQSGRHARDPDADPRTAAAGISVIVFLVALSAGSHWLAPDAALFFFLLAACSASPSEAREQAWFRRSATAAAVVYAAAAILALSATATADEAFRHEPRIGFHPLESGPGGAFRWTMRRFAVWIPPRQTLRLGLANFGPSGQPVAFEARSQIPTLSRVLAPGQATGIRMTAGASPAAVVFSLDRSFVPKRMGLSSDRRSLGLLSTSSADAPGTP
ncbi:MAG: O-antigen ligase family protein [Acidobacteriota bacterium]